MNPLDIIIQARFENAVQCVKWAKEHYLNGENLLSTQQLIFAIRWLEDTFKGIEEKQKGAQ